MLHFATDLLQTDLTILPGLSFPHAETHPVTTNLMDLREDISLFFYCSLR